MPKFKVLIRDFCTKNPKHQFDLTEVEASNREQAWIIVEEELETQSSQCWLMNKVELEALRKVVK